MEYTLDTVVQGSTVGHLVSVGSLNLVIFSGSAGEVSVHTTTGRSFPLGKLEGGLFFTTKEIVFLSKGRMLINGTIVPLMPV